MERTPCRHEYGIDFLVHRKVARAVISCTPVSIRLIAISNSAKLHKVTVVEVCAPTSTNGENEGEKFYQQLDNIMKAVLKKDIFIVLSDWNAKVCPDAYKMVYHQWQ